MISKKNHTWKAQSMIIINSMSPKNNDEEYLIHLRSDNIELMINDKEHEVIEQLFQSLLSRYPIE